MRTANVRTPNAPGRHRKSASHPLGTRRARGTTLRKGHGPHQGDTKTRGSKKASSSRDETCSRYHPSKRQSAKAQRSFHSKEITGNSRFELLPTAWPDGFAQTAPKCTSIAFALRFAPSTGSLVRQNDLLSSSTPIRYDTLILLNKIAWGRLPVNGRPHEKSINITRGSRGHPRPSLNDSSTQPLRPPEERLG